MMVFKHRIPNFEDLYFMKTSGKKQADNFNYSIVSDIQKNNYRVIKINGGILGADQEWFADNLTVDCFKNGDPIPQAQSLDKWREACQNKQAAWCYYNNDETNGKIYNLAAIMDPRGICPEGYRIPDYIDFSILAFNAQEYDPAEAFAFTVDPFSNCRMDQNGIPAGAQKLMGQNGWKKKGKNISGFNLPGGGSRSSGFMNEGFSESGKDCKLWIKPSGWYFQIVEDKRDAGWMEFNILKNVKPEYLPDEKNFSNVVLNNGFIEITLKDYEACGAIRLELINNQGLMAQHYPLKKKDNIDDALFNLTVLRLFDQYNSSRRSGLRTAAFMSGKDHIGLTIADFNTGAFVRPFRYL